jgi:hypothetical protein
MVVFVLAHRKRPLPPHLLFRWWVGALSVYAAITLSAEAASLFGYLLHPYDVTFSRLLMHIGWLAAIPFFQARHKYSMQQT